MKTKTRQETLKVLVIVPTYNERENLEPLIEAIFKQTKAEYKWLHVLVVDDGSPDGTGELADAMALKDPRVFVLHRPAKAGLGRAYLAGFAWALARDYNRMVEMDADFSHDPATLPSLLKASREVDLVLGSRYVEGGGTEHWGLWRKLLSQGGSLYARLLLGLPQRDLTGGFKVFRRTTLEAISLSEVSADGYAFQIELTLRVVKAGLRVLEVPILFKDRRVGQSKMSGGIVSEALFVVWRLRGIRRP